MSLYSHVALLWPAIWLIVSFNLSNTIAFTHLHQPPVAGDGEIHGHVLSHSCDSAVQFVVRHRRGLIFFSELSDDGIKLQSAFQSSNESSRSVITLTLTGKTVDKSDFINGVVLVVPRSELSAHPLFLPKANALPSSSSSESLLGHVLLSVESAAYEKSTDTVTVTAHLASSSDDAITSVSFRHYAARAHHSYKRRFHVYGRHSPFPVNMSSKLQAFSKNKSAKFFSFSADPLSVCVYSAVFDDFGILSLLGIEPVTICRLSLFGIVVDRKISFNAAQLSRSDTSSANAELSLKLSTFASGVYNATAGTLLFWIDYESAMSVTFNCPAGGSCSLFETGIVNVNDYHKLLNSPEGNVQLPELPGFRVTSYVEMQWQIGFFSDAGVSITAGSGYGLNMSAPGDVAALDMARPTGSVSGKIAGLGPFGTVQVKTGIATKFRQTGAIIQNQIETISGVSVSPRDGGYVSVCEESERQIVVQNVLRNVSAMRATTEERLGWKDEQKRIARPEVGSPLVLCI